jgi:hypothetical protein
MNTNLLDLNNDVLNIIGDYVKKDNLDRILKETLKQDLFDYVDMIMKEERKRYRELYGTYHMNRDHARCIIWAYFVKFCRNRFDFEYILDNDNCVEITKIYNEYLTIKKLNLKLH